MVFCCVRGCGSKHTRHGPSVALYCIPTVRNNMDSRWQKLTAERRELWLERVKRTTVGDYERVCSKHFISGKRHGLDIYDLYCLYCIY
jgi:hypothetical protein